MRRHFRQSIILAVLVTIASFLVCCSEKQVETVPESVDLFLRPTMTAVPVTPTPVPTAEPTPSPTPTPDPFLQLAPTTQMSFDELVGDNGDYDLPEGYPVADLYKAIVDIEHQVVLIYTKDEKGEYTIPVRYMLCSTGLGKSTPTGTFRLKKYRVRFGFFQSDKTYAQYWTLIKGRIYFHSMLYSERDADYYIGETYDQLGERASHGCIRLTVPDARFIYYNLAYGTEIEIRQGNPEDTETAAIREKLVIASQPEEHITLFPGQVPYTDNWNIENVSHDLPYKQGSQAKQQ